MTSTKPGTNVYDLNANDYADTVSARPPCLLTKRTQQELRGHRLVNFLWFLTDFKETIRRNKLFGGVNISKDTLVKGTVQRDFRPPGLFIIRTCLGH